MSKEKRIDVRSPIDIKISCLVPGVKNWLEVFNAQAKNISKKGMFLETYDILMSGKTIYMQFYLPNQQVQFTISSKVIWSKYIKNCNGFGVSFVDIGKKYINMIEHFVLKHFDFSSLLDY